MKLYPLLFEPVYVEKIWGGKKLETVFDRKLKSEKIGESWEISDQKNGLTYIRNGELSGKTIQEAIGQWKTDLLGTETPASEFPLLVKIIDAQDVLSVQVHPNDEAVKKYGGATKTEMWVVLHAEEGAALYCGLKEGTDEKALREAIEAGECEKVLNKIPVKAGDAVFIPVGTVHAIGSGLLLYEIQETSDTTYRLYDWNRVGNDGKPRELHLEQSYFTIDYQAQQTLINGLAIKRDNMVRKVLVSCPYFTCENVQVSGNVKTATNPKSFEVITVIDGMMQLISGDKVTQVTKGQSVLLPANLGEYTIKGNVSYLRGYVSKRKDVENELLKERYSEQQIEGSVKGKM